MILSSGIDLQSVPELNGHETISGGGAHLLAPVERATLLSKKSPAVSRCGYLAAKEAFFKALAHLPGCPTPTYLDVQIAHRRNGAPYFHVTGEDLARFFAHHNLATSLAISHSGEYAVAMATIYST
jgi:phosphopantetheine--protein transferase-like protein